MEEIKKEGSRLRITDRREITVDGVKEVTLLDQSTVCLNTSLGELTLEGEDLKIDSLLKSEGVCTVRGRISGIYYETEKRIKKRFGR